jgi:UvrD-like helicase C-terminal domain
VRSSKVTIHKSQGSEFPAVVIPLATQQHLLLQRNLVYTGNNKTENRFSGLLARLYQR